MDLLKDIGMSSCKPDETPLDPNHKFKGKRIDLVNVESYQRLVGRLIYVSHIRPDIEFVVSLVSKFMHSPWSKHLEAIYRILRYPKGTFRNGLYFKKNNYKDVEVFTDADWTDSVVDRRSTFGYCAYVWGNLVTYRSKKQSVVARISADAEYISMALGIYVVMWLEGQLEELRMPMNLLMRLYCDDKAVINIANNSIQRDRAKHVEVDRHFIKEKLECELISVPIFLLDSKKQIYSLNG